MEQVPKSKLTRTALEAAAAVGLKPGPRLVLSALIALAWPHDDGDGWAAECTWAQLLAATGMSRATLWRAISRLEVSGLIRQTKTGRASVFVLATTNVKSHIETSEVSKTTHQKSHIETSEVSKTTLQKSQIETSRGFTPTKTQDFSTTSTTGRGGPPRGGGGGVCPGERDREKEPVDQGGDLNGRAAVCFGLISRKPPWYQGAEWITPRVARQLALIDTVTPSVVEAALESARAKQSGLRRGGVPGYVVSLIREPDMHAIRELEQKRQRQALIEGRQRAQREREEREAAIQRARDEESRARQEQLLAELGEEAVDEAIEAWITSGRSHPLERQILRDRSAEERRRCVFIKHKLPEILDEMGVLT